MEYGANLIKYLTKPNYIYQKSKYFFYILEFVLIFIFFGFNLLLEKSLHTKYIYRCKHANIENTNQIVIQNSILLDN